MFVLTILDLAPVFSKLRRQGTHVGRDMTGLVGLVLCNMAQLSGLILVVLLPITSLSSRPGAAGILAAPLVPLSLALNECKWIVQGWKDNKSDVPVISQRGGLVIFVVVFLVSAISAVVLLWCHAAFEMRLPLFRQPFAGQYGWMSYLAIATLLVGMLASALLINLPRPRSARTVP